MSRNRPANQRSRRGRSRCTVAASQYASAWRRRTVLNGQRAGCAVVGFIARDVTRHPGDES
eukprot:3652531-Pleurochrysis_carterae.AAC.3